MYKQKNYWYSNNKGVIYSHFSNTHTSATPNKYNIFLNNNDTKIKNKNEILNNINKKNINLNKKSNNNLTNNIFDSNNINLNRQLILEENLNNKKET